MATVNFLGYMTIDQLKASGITFDYALPQEWVNMVHDKVRDQLTEGDAVARHFVTVYPEDSTFGGIMPVDFTGAMIIHWYSEV